MSGMRGPPERTEPRRAAGPKTDTNFNMFATSSGSSSSPAAARPASSTRPDQGSPGGSHTRAASYSGQTPGSATGPYGGSTRSLDRAAPRVRIDEQSGNVYNPGNSLPANLNYGAELNRNQDNSSNSLTKKQTDMIQSRVGQVEKHFGDLCTSFASYNRKAGKLRDKGDELSRAVQMYSDAETFNHTSKAALGNFAQCFAAVQDYREAEVRRLNAKVVEPLTLYGQKCRDAKKRLKDAGKAKEKYEQEQKKLEDKKQKKPSDRHSIAETSLQKASVDASTRSKVLDKEIDTFEGSKLTDLKKILMDFVAVELMFHAKALEMHTAAWQALSSISTEEDLEEFRNSLHPPSTQQRLELQRAASNRSLNTTGSVGRRTPTTTPQSQRRATAGSGAAGRPPLHDQHASSTLNTTGTRSLYTDSNQEEYEDGEDDDEYEDEEEEEEDSEDDHYAQSFKNPTRR